MFLILKKMREINSENLKRWKPEWWLYHKAGNDVGPIKTLPEVERRR